MGKFKNTLPPLKTPTPEKKPVSKKTKRTAIITLCVTLCTMAFYYAMLTIAENSKSEFLTYFTMGAYTVILGVVAVTYLIYNKGFVYKNVTPDMLPDDWSDERKTEILETARVRMSRSKWMLIIIFAIIVTFISDVLYLFLWEGIIVPRLGQ